MAFAVGFANKTTTSVDLANDTRCIDEATLLSSAVSLARQEKVQECFVHCRSGGRRADQKGPNEEGNSMEQFGRQTKSCLVAHVFMFVLCGRQVFLIVERQLASRSFSIR
jgi:hypothetical protein